MSGGDWFELAVVIVLIAVVAVLGAAEVSITRTNRVRAYRLQEEGRRGATSLVKIADNPAPFLNVVLLLVLLSTIGGTTIATSLAVRVFHGGGEIIATLAMTVLLFVFAEVTPKTFAIQQTDRVALFLAPLIVGPGPPGRSAGHRTREDGERGHARARACPRARSSPSRSSARSPRSASEEEQIEEGEKELIHSIFEFGDTIVREVMVPRPDIIAIEADKTLRDVQALVLQHGYSRIPVHEDDLDKVVGVVYAKDVLKALHQGKHDMPLSEIVRAAHFVPESKKVAELLREMQKEKFHIALVDGRVRERGRPDRRSRTCSRSSWARSPTSTTPRSPSSSRWPTACTAWTASSRSTR